MGGGGFQIGGMFHYSGNLISKNECRLNDIKQYRTAFCAVILVFAAKNRQELLRQSAYFLLYLYCSCKISERK